MEWLLVPDGLVWVFQKLLIYWDFQAQPSLGFTENGPKNENALFMSEVRGEWADWLDDRKATVTQITTRYNQGMQNTIYQTHNTSNPADGLQQQKNRKRRRTVHEDYNSHKLNKIGQ